MSTILKSLKRLEKEKESIVSKETAMLSPRNMRQGVQLSLKGQWYKRNLFKCMLLGLVIIAGAALLYAYLVPDSTSPPDSGAVQKSPIMPQAPTDELTRAVGTNNPSTSPQTVPPGLAPEPSPGNAAQTGSARSVTLEPAEALALKPAPSSLGRMPAVKMPTEAEPLVADPRVPSEVHPGSASDAASGNTQEAANAFSPSAEDAGSPVPDSETGADRSTDGVNPLYAGAERMTDGRLRVQAIVWSENSEDRMAVVNSRIVREGAQIDEFSIVGIGQNAVYVREGGKLLKVQFGNP